MLDSGDLAFTYTAAFYPSFAPSATVAASGLLDADLAPLEGDVLLLKIGGACAYRCVCARCLCACGMGCCDVSGQSVAEL